MAILVDPAVWAWRGDRWAHLISDDSLDELHAFAAELGRRRFSFQGDHYDIPSGYHGLAIDLGAEFVDARVLARRLRAAGLRLSPARRPPTWDLLHNGPPLEPGSPLLASTLDASTLGAVERALGLGPWSRMIVGRRPDETGVLLAGATAGPDLDLAAIDHDGVHVSRPFDDEPAIELFSPTPPTP